LLPTDCFLILALLHTLCCLLTMTSLAVHDTGTNGGRPFLVRFNELTIHEFPYALGDNPACSEGCPIRLSRTAESHTTVKVDTYEWTRRKRRKGKKLKLSVETRAKLLFRAGYSLEEIAGSTMQVQMIRLERSKCLENTGWERFVNTLIETTGRTLFLPKDIVVGVMGTTGSTIKRMVGTKQKSLRAISA
jgi:hypothetical protein